MKITHPHQLSPARSLQQSLTQALGLALCTSTSVLAQEAIKAPTFQLETAVVEADSAPLIQEPFLAPVTGVTINSGKKTSVIDLDSFPKITNNNYRQALAKTPGLFVSEESTPLVSIGYRGLDPNRVQFTQVLKDGIPIHADQFGYPEAYYTPPLDTVDRMEFLRGGAALAYGPQPGGAINYVTNRPRADVPFAGSTSHTFGSNNYYSTFNHIEGTIGRLGYYGYFNHRKSDGFRTANSDFELFAGNIKLVLDGQTDSRWILSLESYEEEHGEPGGVSLATGAGVINFTNNRDGASRLFDRFKLERTSVSLQWERDFSDDTKLVSSMWSTYYSRYSARQRGGGFGTLPTGADAATNSLELQKFYTQGFETRLRHDYEWLGGNHTIAGGIQFYRTESPREDRRGTRPDATGGDLRSDSDRDVTYLPLFIENKFTWGKLSITPGIRLENVWQGVDEKLNLAKTAAGVPLATTSDHEFVPLVGLGLTYEVAPKVELYGNVSQSYRPKIYTQSVPTDGTALVPNDLKESSAWQYEIGFKGRPTSWVNWDVSAFLLDFDDQIGNVALPGGFTTVGNVGRAQHYGIEVGTELDLIGLTDSLQGKSRTPSDGKTQIRPTLVDRFGSLSLYGNLMLLNAEFVSGPLKGKTPRFAPDHLLRTGIIYRAPREKFTVAFTGTITDDSFADDGNTAQRFVPAHTVWDLTAEAKVWKESVSVNAGINNIFNKDYYNRIRNEGIDPAQGRNFYVGMSVKF
jgi:Fe(3+) dicitrate transport protein